MFYINYVVCKYLLFNGLIFLSHCFILTMWYVNNDLGNRVYLCNERFILTMWYVNALMQYLQGLIDKRFILTMWYVNHTVLLIC